MATAVAPIPAVQDQGFRTAPRARRFQGVRRCRNPVRMSAIHPTPPILGPKMDGGYGAFSPIRRVVSHRLQSADSRHPPNGEVRPEPDLRSSLVFSDALRRGRTHENP